MRGIQFAAGLVHIGGWLVLGLMVANERHMDKHAGLLVAVTALACACELYRWFRTGKW